MSVKPFVMFPKDILFHSTLSITSKLFFSALLHWARTDRGCFASRKTMSKMTGLSLYHIRESIRELVHLGLITETRRGLGNTNVIHIVIDEGSDQDEVGETISSLEVEPFGDPSIYSNKETSINRVEDELGFEADLEEDPEDEKQVLEVLEGKESNPYEGETDCLLESISEKIRPTRMTYFQNLKVVGIDNEEITLYESNKVIRDFLRSRYLEFLSQVCGRKIIIV